MTIVSIRLNEEEKHIFTEYANFHGKVLSTLMKECLIEKMEEELDTKLLAEAKEYNKKHPQTYTHEEIKKDLGL